MKLVKLRIRKLIGGSDTGYAGEAEFENELGKISLNLSSHHIEAIFLVCADSIINISKSAAEELTIKLAESSSDNPVNQREVK